MRVSKGKTQERTAIVILLFLSILFGDEVTQVEVVQSEDMYKVYHSDQLIAEGFREPSIKEYDGMISVLFSCGSPCNYTTYYSTESGTLSEGYFNVIDVNEHEELVLSTAVDHLLLSSIFTDSISMRTEKEFSSVASLSSAIDTAVIENGSVILTYYTGDDFITVTDTIYY